MQTPEGKGTVTDVNLLTGYLSVRIGDENSAPIKVHRDNVKVLRKGKPRPEAEIDEKELKGLE